MEFKHFGTSRTQTGQTQVPMVGTSVVEMKEVEYFAVVENLAVAADITVADPENQEFRWVSINWFHINQILIIRC